MSRCSACYAQPRSQSHLCEYPHGAARDLSALWRHLPCQISWWQTVMRATLVCMKTCSLISTSHNPVHLHGSTAHSPSRVPMESKPVSSHAMLASELMAAQGAWP